MRKWRVGTFSMGLSLILIGGSLLISAWAGNEAWLTLFRWWPVVFVLLGCEVLIYLYMPNKERPFVYYDVFSILFVGVLCVLCVIFAVLTSTGVMQELRYAMGSTEYTQDLPELRQPVPASVKKVIVRSSIAALKVDRAETSELHLFGSYRTTGAMTDADQGRHKEEASTVHIIGDTLYVSIKDLPARRGFAHVYPSPEAVLVVPKELKVEIRRADNQPL
jgi:hypothetical protein